MPQLNKDVPGINTPYWENSGRAASLQLFDYGGDGALTTLPEYYFTFTGPAEDFAIAVNSHPTNLYATHTNQKGNKQNLTIVGNYIRSLEPGFERKLLRVDFGFDRDLQSPFAFMVGAGVLSKMKVEVLSDGERNSRRDDMLKIARKIFVEAATKVPLKG